MTPFNCLVSVQDEAVKERLLKLRGYFEKRAALPGRDGIKSVHCLNALDTISIDEPIDAVLAVRLLGQIENQDLYKRLFKIVKAEIESNSDFTIKDLGSSIMTMPKADTSGLDELIKEFLRSK